MTLFRPQPFGSQLQRCWRQLRRNAQQKRAFRSLIFVAIGGLFLCFSAGYFFLGEGLIFYRQASLHFDPNCKVGETKFALLDANLSDEPGGPGDYLYHTDLLLIKTSTSRFADIIAYARRITSPNDHNLIAVFVSDTVAGQPWAEIAQHSFGVVNHRAVIPTNWVAKLNIYQGGTSSKGTNSNLLDLCTYQTNQELWEWKTHLDYSTDSLTEQMSYWCAKCYALPAHKSRPFNRSLATTDAAYHSPRRLKMRRQKD